MDKYDTILYITPELLNEDERLVGKYTTPAVNQYGIGATDYIDPSLYSAFSFGTSLRLQLNSMGDGMTAEVTDFKKWVVAKVNYHNYITGRTASKTFLIVFLKKGDGMVFSTHNKWRTISGVNQAASYIKSASNALKTETNLKL